MRQQVAALDRMAGRRGFALFMEQGTGKTWTLLADAERAFMQGKIDALFVIAPNGVHTNWTRREIPTHLEAPHVALAWRSGMGKKERARIEEGMLGVRRVGEVAPLRVLAMSYDAVMTKEGLAFAERFMLAHRVMMVLDESRKISNPRAARSKRIMALRTHAVARRIATGTPVPNSPLNVFNQIEFSSPGALGTTSYRAFTAEYADVLPTTHPMIQRMIAANPNAAFAQVVARDEVTGAPIYRNLDRLQKLLEPVSFRITKKECLDLPEKVYKTVFFDLTPKQRREYRQVEKELRVFAEDGTMFGLLAISAQTKIQQITSNFIVLPEARGERAIDDRNPRLEAFREIVEDIPGSFIVWAKFVREIREICAVLTALGISFVTYHGATPKEEREIAVDKLQSGAVRAFVGQPVSGGIGLTLTRAETTVYYSNTYDNEIRLQSEDRNHRIGTKSTVTYIDIVASDTIDERIVAALQRKTAVATALLDSVRFGATESEDN